MNDSELKIKQAMKNAKSSLKIEGLHTSSEIEELVRQRLNKEITQDQFLKKLLKMTKLQK